MMRKVRYLGLVGMLLATTVWAQEGSLEVRILDERGKPVSAATVELLLVEADESETVVRAGADQDGVARLAGPPAGRYGLRVSAQGFLPRELEAVLIPPEGSRKLRLEMSRAVLLAGRVLGPDDRPVPDAAVCLTVLAAPGGGGSLPGKDETCEKSDEQGKVRFAELAHGNYRLRIRSEGRAFAARALNLKHSQEGVTWRLRGGGTVAGRLLGPDDRGIPGAAVFLRDRLRGEAREDRTDEHGRFRVSGLLPGPWDLRIEPPEAMEIVMDGVAVREGEAVDLGALRIRPGLALAGRVLTEDGEPVTEAEVRIYRGEEARALHRKTRTDDNGRFRVEGLREERLEVWVKPEGNLVPAGEEEVVPPLKDLEFVLEPTGRVRGRVSVARGELPPRVRIIASAKDQPFPWSGRSLQAETDEIDPATGEFSIDGVLPSEEVTVTARAAGYWVDPATIPVGGGEEAGPVHLVLERGHVIEGSVRERGGSPVGGARVFAGTSSSTFTDNRGDFALDGLRPGAITLTVTHQDYAPAEARLTAPRTETSPLVIELGEGGTIEGSVLDVDSHPVEGITVTVVSPRQTTVTDHSGRYHLERVASGSRRVERLASGRHEDTERRTVEIADGGTVTVDFRLGAVLEGSVLRGGLPVPWATISVVRPESWTNREHDGGRQLTRADGEGRYRLAGAKPGWATFVIRDGRQRVVRPLEIPPGREPRLDLNLPDKMVEGRVVDARDGSPIAGAGVSASLGTPAGAPEANISWSSMVTDDDGSQVLFQFTARGESRTETGPDGRFLLLVEGEGGTKVGAWAPRYHHRSLDVEPSRGQPVEIGLSRSVQLRVRLSDRMGRPVSKAQVCVKQRGEDGTVNMSSCNSTGGSTTEHEVREERYILTAGSPGFGTSVIDPLEVRATENGEPVEVPITLAPGAALLVRFPWSLEQPPRLKLLDPLGNDLSFLVNRRSVDTGAGEVRWTTHGLEPGLWQVWVEPPDAEPIVREVDVVAGPTMEIRLP